MGLPRSTDPAQVHIEVFDDVEALTEGIASKLLRVVQDTLSAEGIAHISLTGGGAGIKTLEAAAGLIRRDPAAVPDWSAVHFWWGDERLLPIGDGERNETQAREALLDQLVADHGLPEENIHPMPSSEDAAHPEAGAQMYACQLEQFAPAEGIIGLAVPPLAVMLLGVGPDGHINSLFPGKDSLRAASQSTTGEEEAPEQLGPPLRVTLTFDAVHTARRVWTCVAGADKAKAVARALAPGAEASAVPAAAARGALETVWHLDSAAAAELPG